jgi:hypothetical protein
MRSEEIETLTAIYGPLFRYRSGHTADGLALHIFEIDLTDDLEFLPRVSALAAQRPGAPPPTARVTVYASAHYPMGEVSVLVEHPGLRGERWLRALRGAAALLRTLVPGPAVWARRPMGLTAVCAARRQRCVHARAVGRVVGRAGCCGRGCRRHRTPGAATRGMGHRRSPARTHYTTRVPHPLIVC